MRYMSKFFSDDKEWEFEDLFGDRLPKRRQQRINLTGRCESKSWHVSAQ